MGPFKTLSIVETFGCLMISFGLPLALFVLVIARDPLRIILFVLGAFFWLVALLLSSLVWFAVYPLRQTLVFGLCFSVLFQELFRMLLFFLLRAAHAGLEKVSANGLALAGVHSLKNARHTTAVVGGLGMGVIAGLFSMVNVAAASMGPGAPGFPQALAADDNLTTTAAFVDNHADFTFLFTTSLGAMLLVLLHVVWTVVFWEGCTRFVSARQWLPCVGVVVASHYACSLVSLLNERQWYGVTLAVPACVLVALSIVAWAVAGGSARRLRSAASLGRSAAAHLADDDAAAASPREVVG